MSNIILVSSIVLFIAFRFRAAYWRSRFERKCKESDEWMLKYINKSAEIQRNEQALHAYRELINGALKLGNDNKN